MTKTNAALGALLTILAIGSTARADMVTEEQSVCQGKEEGGACPLPDGSVGTCILHKNYPKPQSRLFCEVAPAASATSASATPSASSAPPNADAPPVMTDSASAPPAPASSAAPTSPSSPPTDSGGCSAGSDSRGSGLAVLVGGIAFALVAARKRTRRER